MATGQVVTTSDRDDARDRRDAPQRDAERKADGEDAAGEREPLQLLAFDAAGAPEPHQRDEGEQRPPSA